MRYPRHLGGMADILNLLGRVLIAGLFLGGAWQKLNAPAPVQAMLSSVGLPGGLVWALAAFNAAAGVMLVTGPHVQVWALVLAVYCMVTSWFHLIPTDPWQMTIFVKNWAIAGGLLVLAAQGPGRFAY
ncbi:DoxX family protein [Falsirhodobacter xinxiangensis]|uniref:DoxX family protein n=1 Tax=Falsirhodobacter xinxiangensis TaxID=2530049 RepID=UPI00319E39D4